MTDLAVLITRPMSVVAIFLQHSDSLVPMDVLITPTCSPEYLCIASQASLMCGIAQYVLAQPFVNAVETHPLNSFHVVVYP